MIEVIAWLFSYWPYIKPLVNNCPSLCRFALFHTHHMNRMNSTINIIILIIIIVIVDMKQKCKFAVLCVCRCPLPMILLAEEGCSTIVEVSY